MDTRKDYGSEVTFQLIKYKNGIWVIQDTNYLTEDSIYTYYEASMPEFSTVAIVGTIITTGEITTVSEFNYFFIVIAVILIIISIVIILFKTGILYIEEENTEEKENR